MRKHFIWILTACLLLAGCGGRTDVVAVTVVETGSADAEMSRYEQLLEQTPVVGVDGTAVSPDGRFRVQTAGESEHYVSGLRPPERLQLVDAGDGRVLWEREGDLRQSVLWSPDSRYAALVSAGRTWNHVTVVETERFTTWQFTLPDGSSIPEYTFLPEDWGEWLEANTLLLTVGRGGDAGEQHTYRCSLEMDGEHLTAVSVLEQTGEVLDAGYDFTHDGLPEELERMTLLDPDTEEPLWHELWLRNGDGERMWSYAMAAGGPSWETTLFALEVDGQDCLMELVTAMGQGYCSYFYEVFSLSETGERQSVELGEVQFDVNFASPIHESFDCAHIADFLWRVKELTAGADTILMDMDAADGLRCGVPAVVFTHDYHCGEFVALDSQAEMEAALERMKP